MAEKNIFVYKLLLSLNISDFIFYVKTATPKKKEGGECTLSEFNS